MGGTRKKHLKALLAANPECRYCLRRVVATTATLDHVVPVSRGGNNQLTNLVLACKDCNGYKADKSLCTWSDIVPLILKENFYGLTKPEQKRWMAEVTQRPDVSGAAPKPDRSPLLWDATQYLWGVKLGRNKSAAKHWLFPGCPKGLSPGRRKELLKNIVFKKQGGCHGCKSTTFGMNKARFSLRGDVLYLLCEACHPDSDTAIAVMTAPPQKWMIADRANESNRNQLL